MTIFATLVYSKVNKIDKNDLTVLAGTRVDVMYWQLSCATKKIFRADTCAHAQTVPGLRGQF